ncbi:enterochelin esterase domain-containing protein, partial [Acinetobacter baumannii]
LAPDVPELPEEAEAWRGAVPATAQADPLNPRPWWPADPRRDRYTSSSVLELEDAPASPWLARRPGVAEGQVWRRRFTS